MEGHDDRLEWDGFTPERVNIQEAPTMLLGPFVSLEAAARYAETHDVGKGDPLGSLPEARGGTLTGLGPGKR
jgi:hypothetical protein